MTEETNRCPKCGGEAVPIIYGLVPLVPGGPRPEIFKAHDRGELRWGGCSPPFHSPLRWCSLSSTQRVNLILTQFPIRERLG